MIAANPDKRALTIAEAGRYACVSRATIENWLAKGLLPCEELPSSGSGVQRFRRIRLTDLHAFLDGCRGNGAALPVKRKTKKVILLPR